MVVVSMVAVVAVVTVTVTVTASVRTIRTPLLENTEHVVGARINWIRLVAVVAMINAWRSWTTWMRCRWCRGCRIRRLCRCRESWCLRCWVCWVRWCWWRWVRWCSGCSGSCCLCSGRSSSRRHGMMLRDRVTSKLWHEWKTLVSMQWRNRSSRVAHGKRCVWCWSRGGCWLYTTKGSHWILLSNLWRWASEDCTRVRIHHERKHLCLSLGIDLNSLNSTSKGCHNDRFHQRLVLI